MGVKNSRVSALNIWSLNTIYLCAVCLIQSGAPLQCVSSAALWRAQTEGARLAWSSIRKRRGNDPIPTPAMSVMQNDKNNMDLFMVPEVASALATHPRQHLFLGL